jgi:hypothetical protein
MKPRQKLTSQRQQEQQTQAAEQQLNAPSAALEFSSVEEMLRHDSMLTPVPPRIEQRLQESVAQMPPAARPWWKRILGA